MQLRPDQRLISRLQLLSVKPLWLKGYLFGYIVTHEFYSECNLVLKMSEAEVRVGKESNGSVFFFALRRSGLLFLSGLCSFVSTSGATFL